VYKKLSKLIKLKLKKKIGSYSVDMWDVPGKIGHIYNILFLSSGGNWLLRSGYFLQAETGENVAKVRVCFKNLLITHRLSARV